MYNKFDLLWDALAYASSFLKQFDDDDINLIYRTGCRKITIGAEPGDQQVLDVIAKQAKVEDSPL